MSAITLYDATLREGNQAEDIAFSLEDKLRITERLDSLGVHYIEGGWPSSNPKDGAYFEAVRQLPLEQAVVVAFGSTARPGTPVAADRNLNDLVRAGTEAVTIFGKSWDLHVRDVLRISMEENLQLISESVAFLKQRVPTVFFDAEHFFDGFRTDPEYAIRVLEHARAGGADALVLCDTNGGTLPFDVHRVCAQVRARVDGMLGIHAHNDSDVAVANSLAAVECGATMVQCTVNGFGERCGNANLCSVVANLKLKLDRECVTDAQLRMISEVSRFVSELANFAQNKHQPFVGSSAFAHKAGVHVSAVRRDPRSYEHIQPELVGNSRGILLSDQAGRNNILEKARQFNLDIASRDPVVQDILTELKELEQLGFQFEGAEASFELRMRRALGQQRRYFDLVGFRVMIEKKEEAEPYSEATIMVRVRGSIEHTAAVGNGPVNALDNALRKALETFYPALASVELIDYKVRVLQSGVGTGARVRVLVESGDGRDCWGTVGVSQNIIEASWQALTDSITYKLLKDEAAGQSRHAPIQ